MNWRFDSPRVERAPGAQSFLEALTRHGAIFDRSLEVIVARAPGRLDLMGGIADYSGSLVLEWPLAAATWVAMQWSDDRTLEVTTALGDSPATMDAHVRLPLDDALGDYETVRARFARDPKRHWLAYVLGAITVLSNEQGVRFSRGLRVLVASSVPAGKGVSSSAALEVATMRALVELLGIALPGRDLALLAQKVENHVAGAPCGVMDQITSACGRKDALVALECQPARIEGLVKLPDSLALFGIDSGLRHEVKGADYGSVRTGSFMGYRIVAGLAGLRVANLGAVRVAIDDPRWRGYLANLTPNEWATFESQVPVSLQGGEFLATYGGITDEITRVDPTRVYAVRTPTAHPIHENARVREFRTLLSSPSLSPSDCERLGEWMYASHASYGACGLGSRGTDRLVELVRATGPARGLFGAKITGGGSGGTVAVLAGRDATREVQRIASDYAREAGRGGVVIEGSSDGAMEFGVARVRC